jgi:hypothetical protein
MSLLDTASLIVTPNAYKEGKLYSVIPSDGSGDLSVTRATTATRVNSAGLVELVPYNLFQYSEQFDNANWNKTNITVTANAGTAPNGTLTADRITATANSATINSLTPQTVQIYTFSVWVKAESGTVSGSIYGISSFATRTNFVATTEWQRITNTALSLGSNRFPTIQLDTSGTSILVWGAQLVEGSTAKDYYPTITRLNIPRLDYSLGSCPSLLVEPQRTNLVTDSETYSSTWGSNFTSITKNLLSPSGIINASTLVNSVGSNRSIGKPISVVSGQTYVLSFWIKKISGSFPIPSAIQLTSWGAAVASQTYTNLGTTLTNDWVRYTHTFTATSTNTVNIQLISNQVNTIGVWGAQLEAGAYPTSYIPTTSASVTRNNDIISKTSATALIGQTEGTFFVDFNYFALISAPSTIEVVPLEIGNGSANNRMYLSVFQGDLYVVVFTGGSPQVITNLGAITQGRHKVGVSYINNNLRAYLDGAFIASDTSVTLPTLSNIYVGSFSNAIPQAHSINVVTLWKERLSNDELTALTTL